MDAAVAEPDVLNQRGIGQVAVKSRGSAVGDGEQARGAVVGELLIDGTDRRMTLARMTGVDILKDRCFVANSTVFLGEQAK